MSDTPRKVARVLLSILSLGSLGVCYYKLHASACTADLKGGTWGNFEMALHLEAQGFSFALAGTVLLGIVLALSPVPISFSTRLFRLLVSSVVLLGLVFVSGFILPIQANIGCTK